MDYTKVRGFDKLTEDQKELFINTSKKHIDWVGLDYKEDKEPVIVWINENDIICTRLKDGKGYYYLMGESWF